MRADPLGSVLSEASPVHSSYALRRRLGVVAVVLPWYLLPQHLPLAGRLVRSAGQRPRLRLRPPAEWRADT